MEEKRNMVLEKNGSNEMAKEVDRKKRWAKIGEQ